jgi:hypothetical protein
MDESFPRWRESRSWALDSRLRGNDSYVGHACSVTQYGFPAFLFTQFFQSAPLADPPAG